MPHLDSLISFPAPTSAAASSSRTPIPPATSHIVVTDTLDSPASFVLIHFLRAALAGQRSASASPLLDHGKGKAKASFGRRAIWIGCDANGLGHWRNLVRRSGVQLDAEAASGRFRFLDASAVLLRSALRDAAPASARPNAPPPMLKLLYDHVADELRQIRHQREQAALQSASDEDRNATWEAETLIFVDDLSALAWSLESVDGAGRPVDVGHQVTKWIRALRALAAKYNACLISLQHADATSVAKTSSSSSSASDAVDETIFRSLTKTADVWIEVKELGSGRARDCDGEITVHPLVRPSLAGSTGPAQPGTEDAQATSAASAPPPIDAFALETPCPSRAKAMLYRIAPDGQVASTGGGAGGLGTSTGRVQVWARGTGRGFL